VHLFGVPLVFSVINMELLSADTLSKQIRIRCLYESAFPQYEKKPFSRILQMKKKGKTDLWYISHNGKFVGMASTVNSDDIIMIDYFAIERKLRGMGYGTLAIEALLSQYHDKGVFVEIEAVKDDAENADERIRRREFYRRCGLVDFGTSANVFGVEMELLGIRCMLDFDGYHSFYSDNIGKYTSDHILPIK